MSTLDVDLAPELKVEELEARAASADSQARSFTEIDRIWRELAAGAACVRASFLRRDRCYVVTGSPDATPDISSRDLDILRRSLLGQVQKVIAIELGLRQSTVAAAAARALYKIGVRCTATRIPFLLMMAAQATAATHVSLQARVSVLMVKERWFQVFSVARPEPGRLVGLSPAEQEVVDLVVERRSNAEIAAIRCTSQRTIANQLASVAVKLRVQGRSGILCRVIANELETLGRPDLHDYDRRNRQDLRAIVLGNASAVQDSRGPLQSLKWSAIPGSRRTG